MVHFKLVKIIDLFKFSNTYLARPRLAKLAYSPKKQQDFIDYLKQNVRLENEALRPALDNFPITKLSAYLGCLT